MILWVICSYLNIGNSSHILAAEKILNMKLSGAILDKNGSNISNDKNANSFWSYWFSEAANGRVYDSTLNAWYNYSNAILEDIEIVL